MNVLQMYEPHSALFASPMGTLLTYGSKKRQFFTNASGLLAQQARQLLRAHPEVEYMVGLLPFNTNQPAQLLIPEQAHYTKGYSYAKNTTYASTAIQHIQARPTAAVFEKQVEQALAALQQTPPLQKLVMARHLDLQLSQALDRTALLDALWQKNPKGYTYTIPLDNSTDPATFLGASPELLLRKQANRVYLNPLAGTALRDLADPEQDQRIAQQLQASAKDRHEHAIVIENILEALSPFCDHLTAAATPSLVSTATLWHLSTEIHGELKSPYADALTLALAVHPTPAVCGHPTLLARDLIESIESEHRGFFAGAVGWMNQAGDGEWAVAIRCAHYQNQQLRLSAGAGIVIGSDAQAERIETGNKLRTMLNALQIPDEQIQQGITQ